MKKRKILYLFPLAALVLSGCTLQEGWDVVKDFSVNKVYEPVRDFFLNLFGKEVPKKEEEEQKPSGEGEGEGGGEHEGETSKYGTLEHPLTVSEAVALIGEAAPTEQEMFVTGTVRDNEAWSTDYGNTSINLTDGTSVIKVFRAQNFPAGFDKEGIKQNSMKGQTVVAKGFGDKYNNTFELTEPEVLSITGEAEKPEEVDNYGTAENPLTVSQAIEVIKKQDPTLKPLFVTGEVSKNTAWSTQYGNVDIYITDGTAELELFRADKFPQGFVKEDIKEDGLVGATVVATGTGMYYADGKKYELKQGCEVLSIQEQVIEITGVELSQSELSLEVGQQATLTAKVLPEDKASQEVTWTVTTNDAPAEVISCNNGTIVAQAAGTAVVTATSVADPSKTAECTVTVKEATKELQSIAFAGEVKKTEYDEDESYSIDGLKVMAHYNIGDDEDITENATITLSKATAELGDTSFTVTASYGNLQSIEKVINVTVNEVNQFVEAYEAALALSSGATEQYTFKGVIAAKRQDNEWFIQHNGYGIEYYGSNENFAVGKQVKVKATLQKFNGLPETKTIASAVVVGDGTMPNPIEITTVAEQNAAKLNVLANVTGVAKEDWSSYSAAANSTLKLAVADGDIDVYLKKNLFSSQEAELKAVKAGDTVSFGNVVTSTYNNPQILFVAGSDLTVTPAPVKEIASITSITGPNEVALNGTVSTNDVTVVVEYTDGSSGNAKVTAVTVDTTSAGEKTADVTIEGWNETLHFNVTVTSDGPVTPTYYDATMAKGTDAYDDGTVNGKPCIKIGTSKKGGTMTITVPAGAVELKVYACAWNGVSGLSLNITSDKTGVTASPAALALTADSGASNNSPFTIADESIHLFTVTLTGVTEQTVLTFTTSAAKRAIVWGAQYAL